MREALKAMWQFLGVQSLRTSVYHPQMNGLIEQFNGTQKKMLRKYMAPNGTDWPAWLHFLFVV